MSQKRKRTSADSNEDKTTSAASPKQSKHSDDSTSLDSGVNSDPNQSTSASPQQILQHKKEDVSDPKKGRWKYEFFFGKQYPFSQFHPAKFVIDGVEYNCAEQYMMHQKAVEFGDEDIAKQIMTTDDPKKMKAFGRKVKNFDKRVWYQKSLEVVKKGNIAKFSQNSSLKKQLFNTFPKTLAEANPQDRLWGIGLKACNPKAWSEKTWFGKNLLGYCLTDIRDQLMKEEGQMINNSLVSLSLSQRYVVDA